MKRILVVTLFFLYSFSNIFAQEGPAKAAFAAGDYSAAVQLYQVALSTTNEDNQASISKAIEKAKKCINLLKQGDAEYLDRKFESAKSTYLSVLKYNPDDKYAKSRVNLCDNQIIAAANKLKEDAELKEALKDGQMSSLQAFVDKYPQNSKSQLLSAIIKNYDLSLDKKKTSDYILWGDLYFEAGNRISAQLWYDRACTFGSTEALYKKALTYDDITAIEPLSLLVLSSVEGYEPAKDKLIAIKGDNKYDTEVAKRLYKHLCNYRSSLESYVYLYENRGYYPIDRLELADVAKEHYRNLTTINKMKDDDNLIYHFATIIEKVNMEPKQLYQLAASKGNIDAVRWIYNQEKNSLNAEGRRAYENFLEDFNNEMYKSYLKYLKGDEMSSRDWSRVGIYDYDKHEELLSRSFSMNYNYEVKSFKKFIKRYNDTPWDKDVVDYIKQKVAYYSPEYSKRILKIISKLNTSENQYDIAGNPTYKMVKAGYTENPHAYIKSVSRELQLWTHFRSSSAKTSTKPSTNSSKVTTSYSPSNVNLVVGQYYEHLGGIVFYLDGTNRHGKVMSIKHTTQAMDKNSAVRWMNSNCGAGWRFPSVDELYILQQKQSVINRTYCQINRNKVIIDNYNIHWTDAGYCLSIGNAWRKKTTGELRSKTTGGVLAVKDF